MSVDSFPSRKPATADRSARITRLSRVMIVVVQATTVILPLGVALYWLGAPAETLARDARIPVEWLAGFDLPQRLLALMVSLVPVAVLLWGLAQVRACLAAFARGELFGADTARGLRNLALAMAGAAAIGPIAGAVMSVVLSWGAPAGQKQIALSLGSDQLLMLLFAGMLALVSWAMLEAAEIARENAGFV